MMDSADLDEPLAQSAHEHGVVGASVAVLQRGELATAAAGLLNRVTGLAVTPDSVFQVGSVAKVHTALAVMRLADDGRLDLDAPVRDVLPEFRVADPHVTSHVNPRHLLTHTSGISGDHYADTGRGDDAVERFVALASELGSDVPLGTVFSYSNTGFVVLGRMIEVVTDMVWDRAIRELVLDPLELRHTVTLPEDVPRFRWAYGHYGPEGGLAPMWSLPRSLSPCGSTMVATATDLVTMGRVFLAGDPHTSGFLSPAALAAIRRPHVSIPDRWTFGPSQGLGIQLGEEDGQHFLRHDGATLGQRAYFEVWPESDAAIGLVTTGGDAHALAQTLLPVLRERLCGVWTPARPEPVEEADWVDEGAVVGRYERFGMRVDIARGNGGFYGREVALEPLASQLPDPGPYELTVRPSTVKDVFVFREDDEEGWRPMIFFELEGSRYMHAGARSQRRVDQ